MTDFVDKTKPVREGEELDLGALKKHLQANMEGSGELVVEQFPGGHSNLTYLLRWGDRELVLRTPPRGSKVKTAHDMSREYRVLSKLAPVYDKAPKPLVFCDDHSVLGKDFYVMERLRGVVLRKRLPAGMSLDEDTARKLSEVMVDTLAELHTLDLDAIGLGDFGKPPGYVERQIRGWTKRYDGSATDDIPQVEQIAGWLTDNLPADGYPGLIHNDFKFDNVILDPDDITKVVGILDWEMCTTGDSRMDLGTSLCYWIEATDPHPLRMAAFGPTALPGMYARREFADRWATRTGYDLGDEVFYYCYGLFKLAVVAQQIYYRYAQGLTQDERFAQMIHAVRVLAEHAVTAAERGSLMSGES